MVIRAASALESVGDVVNMAESNYPSVTMQPEEHRFSSPTPRGEDLLRK
jgi:hypothetical protein